MNSVSKLKVIAGYALLLAALIFSLCFVHREMENLMRSDDEDVQWMDSLITLLHEKDANTITMLRTLSEANEDMLSTREIEEIIAAAQPDTLITQQRVQRRFITHLDTVVTKPEKKGFFRRLGEVFVPPKKDSTVQVKTSFEYATDTLLDVYNPVDSLQEKLRVAAQQKKKGNAVVQRRKRTLQRMNHALTARIDSLLKDYEQENLQHAREKAEYQQAVRRDSIRTLSGIAAGAVLLSAVFLVIIGRDITRSNRYRKELEEAHRRTEDLLAMREKMMLAITHDFKAPLSSIMGYADLLSRLTVDDRQQFYLNNMKTSSEHLQKLVVDLLEFHRLDLHKAEINRVAFHPARLLEEIAVSFRPLTTAKGLTLRCEVSPELENSYICDPLRLRQIINNLLSNAVKFTDHGSVTMSARYESRRLVVSIADTGKGMDPADRDRIFQEFTRLPGAQGKEGFGLGLSIVRMLVQLLEGTIEVDSVPGQGSTFTVRIPLFPVRIDKRNTSDASGTQAEPSAETVSGPLRVLLIDDDRIQLTLTAAMLRQNGIDSVSCLQPDELLNALRTESFDVLLTDVQMPALSGFDLLQLLRASHIPRAQTIPVIAVTARSDMQPDEFVSHGFSGCLYKPFTVAELLAALKMKVDIPSAVSSLPYGETTVSPSSYDFAALTAFSGDDAEAAKSIFESFVSETRQNRERLQQAVVDGNTDELAAIAHKMIPLCTLIRATDLVASLRRLENLRGTPFTNQVKENAVEVIALIKNVVDNAVLPG